MRISFFSLLLCICLPVLSADIPQRLYISDNKHYIVDENGKPFFYLADTAWELFHKLDRDEADLYLENRAAKGFNVVQAVAIAELDGISAPNAYGHLPFVNQDPSRPDVKDGPDDDYWDHVDYIVKKANSLGIYVAMLPTWGRYWKDGDNPPFNPENAYVYGKWLASRYKDARIIWVLGGDRTPEGERQFSVIREMARGLQDGDGKTHLITFHPKGATSSSMHFHGEEWLDFNMCQNGHNHWYELYIHTLEDYNRTDPQKPVIDGEPIYEDHPVQFDAARRGHSVAADCRRAMYWDLFNGACGHTYGHHSVWQMWDPSRSPYPVNNPLMPWYEAIDQPGSGQMQWGMRLVLSRPFENRIPATHTALKKSDIETAWPGQGMYHFSAMMDKEGTYVMVYAPVGRKFTVVTSVVKGNRLNAWWFNPRTGESTFIGTIANRGEEEFISPDAGEEMDWVLVLDDESKGYSRPGK